MIRLDLKERKNDQVGFKGMKNDQVGFKKR